MTITIYKGYDNSYVLLGSRDKRFAEAWGSVYRASTTSIYKDLETISAWANNTLGEECLFEVE